MEKRNLDDLWSPSYNKFNNNIKVHYGLDVRCHIRHQQDRRNGNSCLVYVIRRSQPSEGFDKGNFAIDQVALKWTVQQQTLQKVVQAYVALVEDFGGDIVNHETAKNVVRYLQDCTPYIGSEGNSYYWVDENFHPFGGGRRDFGGVLTNPPF